MSFNSEVEEIRGEIGGLESLGWKEGRRGTGIDCG